MFAVIHTHVVLSCWLALIAASGAASAHDAEGTLTVLVTDQAGAIIKDAKVQITSASGVSRVEPGGKAVSGLPYDVYQVKVTSAGFRSQQKVVKLYAPSVLAVVSLPLGYASGREYWSLRGRFVGMPKPAGAVCFAKFLPIFGEIGAEAAVDREGKFSVTDLDPGEYAVILVQDGRPMLVGRIHVTGDDQMEIPVRECAR